MNQTCDEMQELLSGYLDGELTQQQSQRVHLHIQNCLSCRAMYDDLKTMKQGIASMEKQTLSEKELQRLMTDKTATSSAWIGWLLLIGSLSVVLAIVVYQFFMNDQTSLWIKLLVSAFYGGIAFLFLSVLRQRWIARKTDRYKGVDL